MKMALVHIKGDWAEHCGTLGFPNWTSGLRPCLFLHCRHGLVVQH